MRGRRLAKTSRNSKLFNLEATKKIAIDVLSLKIKIFEARGSTPQPFTLQPPQRGTQNLKQPSFSYRVSL